MIRRFTIPIPPEGNYLCYICNEEVDRPQNGLTPWDHLYLKHYAEPQRFFKNQINIHFTPRVLR